MIQLTENQKRWILLCKNHLAEEFPYTGSWANTLKPLFNEIYGWDPDKDNSEADYLNTMFEVLFDIHTLIADDECSYHRQVKKIFSTAFYKSITRDEDNPIRRAIAELCALIQGTKVLDDNGERRFDLTDGNDDEMYYMQSGYVGNAMLFWRKCKSGYTEDVKKRTQIHQRRSRATSGMPTAYRPRMAVLGHKR